MIALRQNCVAQYKMNDNAANPYVAGLSGVPTELVQNNYFMNSSFWSFGSGWSFADSYARFTGDGDGTLSQDVGIVSGKKYIVAFDVPNFSVVGLSIRVGGAEIASIGGDGIYGFMGTAGGSNSLLEFYAAGMFPSDWLKLDNVFCFSLDDFPNTGVFMDLVNENTSAHSVAGKIGQALDYDGVNDRSIVHDEGALLFASASQNFSFLIWFRRGRSGQLEVLLDKDD